MTLFRGPGYSRQLGRNRTAYGDRTAAMVATDAQDEFNKTGKVSAGTMAEGDKLSADLKDGKVDEDYYGDDDFFGLGSLTGRTKKGFLF